MKVGLESDDSVDGGSFDGEADDVVGGVHLIDMCECDVAESFARDDLCLSGWWHDGEELFDDKLVVGCDKLEHVSDRPFVGLDELCSKTIEFVEAFVINVVHNVWIKNVAGVVSICVPNGGSGCFVISS